MHVTLTSCIQKSQAPNISRINICFGLFCLFSLKLFRRANTKRQLSYLPSGCVISHTVYDVLLQRLSISCSSHKQCTQLCWEMRTLQFHDAGNLLKLTLIQLWKCLLFTMFPLLHSPVLFHYNYMTFLTFDLSNRVTFPMSLLQLGILHMTAKGNFQQRKSEQKSLPSLKCTQNPLLVSALHIEYSPNYFSFQLSFKGFQNITEKVPIPAILPDVFSHMCKVPKPQPHWLNKIMPFAPSLSSAWNFFHSPFDLKKSSSVKINMNSLFR